MNIIDYRGRLNNHEEYTKILKKLETKCNHVEIVILNERKSNELVDEFKNDILEIRKVTEWWGTKTKEYNNLYKIKASKKFFEYLQKYETFCKFYFSKNGEYSEKTNFGDDDIAFYDKNNKYLLLTTTHEGEIYISNELI